MTIFYDYILDELRLKDVPDGSGGFWGSFYDTTTQTISSTASEYPIKLNSLSGSNGISRASLTERVVFDYPGVYSITFSIQFENSKGKSRVLDFGNGTCDNQATVEVTGRRGRVVTRTITLK